jgi:hypothetical protein
MGCWPDDDLGRVSVGRWPQGAGDGCVAFSLRLSLGSEMDGATKDVRSPRAVLLRLEGGALPVCCEYSAFFLAMAAAASGNMAIMAEGSNPELRLLAGEGSGRPTEFREPSSFWAPSNQHR